MSDNITKLVVVDFDGTLSDSPQPEWGVQQWEEKTGETYPYVGWWSKPHSLDVNVFDIKFFPKIEKITKNAYADNQTYVTILTARIDDLKSSIENVLNVNNVAVDRVDTKTKNIGKGERLLEYLNEFPNIEEIDVYDDNYEREITSYLSVKDEIPNHIKFNIYHVNQGNVRNINQNSVENIVDNEIDDFINEIKSQRN